MTDTAAGLSQRSAPIPSTDNVYHKRGYMTSTSGNNVSLFYIFDQHNRDNLIELMP